MAEENEPATFENAQLPASRLVGYARVSTDDQNLRLQIDALTKQSIPYICRTTASLP